MNKKEFLKTLRDKLSILEKEEIDDIIEEYSNHIDEKISDGKTEEEAVAGFGDATDLAREILKGYKIRDDYSSNDLANKLSKFIKDLVDSTVNFFNNLSKDKNIDVTNTLASILIALFLIFIVNLAISVIYHLGSVILGGRPWEFVDPFVIIWAIIINIVRVIAIITIIYSTYNNIINNKPPMFFKEKETSKPKKKDTTAKKSIKEEKDYSYNYEYKYDYSYKKEPVTDKPISIGLIIAKIFAVIFSIPFICMIIGLSIAIAVFIGLMIKGVVFAGITLILLGLIFICSSFVGFLFSLVGGRR